MNAPRAGVALRIERVGVDVGEARLVVLAHHRAHDLDQLHLSLQRALGRAAPSSFLVAYVRVAELPRSFQAAAGGMPDLGGTGAVGPGLMLSIGAKDGSLRTVLDLPLDLIAQAMSMGMGRMGGMPGGLPGGKRGGGSPLGRIAFAHTDRGGMPYIESSVEHARAAVDELLKVLK